MPHSNGEGRLRKRQNVSERDRKKPDDTTRLKRQANPDILGHTKIIIKTETNGID